MDERDLTPTCLRPTSMRPLLGLTILLVEDSLYTCDAIRLMCVRSGARLRRADCIASARRHLQVYRPSVVIIDLGLPDGRGTDLIAELANSVPRVGALLGISGDPFAEDVALAAGADAFMEKPFTSLAAFQRLVMHNLPVDQVPKSPRLVQDQAIAGDPMAYNDDLAQARTLLLERSDIDVMRYAAQMIGGAARAIGDAGVAFAADQVLDTQENPHRIDDARGCLLRMIDDRLDTRMAI